MELWVINMIFCITLGFGSFAWGIWMTMQAEAKKKKSKSA